MVIKLVNFVSNIGLEYGTVLGMHLPNSWNIKEDPELNSPCQKKGGLLNANKIVSVGVVVTITFNSSAFI